MIVIIDYGVGNLRSILSKFERLKIEAIISSDADEIRRTDFCTINANVMIASESKILPLTYIGMGANIIQRVTIGKNCKIAANSFVTRNLKENSHVLGVPARSL